jgi:hypothetical protein
MFYNENANVVLSFPICATRFAHLIFLYLITLLTPEFDEEFKL